MSFKNSFGKEVLLFVYLFNVSMCERVCSCHRGCAGQGTGSGVSPLLPRHWGRVRLVDPAAVALGAPGWLPMSFWMMLLLLPPISYCKRDRVADTFHHTGLICGLPESIVWVAPSSADPYPYPQFILKKWSSVFLLSLAGKTGDEGSCLRRDM